MKKLKENLKKNLRIYANFVTVVRGVRGQEVTLITSNQIAYWNLQETKRTNLAKEGETNRSNLASEGIRSKEAEIKDRAQRAQQQRWEDQTFLDAVNTSANVSKTIMSNLATGGLL